ncbi:hypothetical protein [Stakelama saccharophila]|uniref:STAS/SEC14 domain-containing protein n=1 Tax=Stakelama saccharophila TaxID=3075605 RepID=A0ABZ0BAQ2_9SPHN|nr:hypothetical protein [Stakelama sp. W311]WNO54145.1 hypothetical protein RPR59_02480 [Stakelama sp. W311]
MRDDSYRLAYDGAKRRIDAVVSGYWDMAVFDRYASELLALAARARRSGRPFDIRCDSRGYAVQSVQIAQAFAELSHLADDLNGGRATIVVGTTLLKLQAKHVFRQPNVAVFDRIHDADAWLKTGGAGNRARARPSKSAGADARRLI